MKKMNKKGFTIVELVIVIAVIAIMSAVLIPTFSGIIKKAKLSSDKKTIASMNEVLVETILETDAEFKYSAAVDALEASGFNAKSMATMWQPSSKGYSAALYINGDKVTMVLVNEGKVAYAADDKLLGETVTYNTDGGNYYLFTAGNYKVKSTAATADKAVEDISNAVANGNSIKLTKTYEEPIVRPVAQIAEDATVTVDLGGNKIATTDRGDGQAAYGFNVYGELTLENAVIEGRGVEVRAGGTMILEETVTVGSNGVTGGAAIYVYEGATCVVNGGTYKNTVANEEPLKGATAIVSYGDLTVNGGTFESCAGQYAIELYSGNAKFNNVNVKATRGCIAAMNDAVCTVNGGTFEQTTKNYGTAYVFYANSNAKITITGNVTASYCYELSCIENNGVIEGLANVTATKK